jgi:branched-subunit amino acid ABC-type transport system permease component
LLFYPVQYEGEELSKNVFYTGAAPNQQAIPAVDYLMGNLSLPYNRLVIIGFAAVVLLGVALLISRTRLGLFVRGVTQNRPIASCMGVNTARIDTYAFALGSGIAGLAKIAVLVFIIIFIQKRPQGIFAMKGRSAEA